MEQVCEDFRSNTRFVLPPMNVDDAAAERRQSKRKHPAAVAADVEHPAAHADASLDAPPSKRRAVTVVGH